MKYNHKPAIFPLQNAENPCYFGIPTVMYVLTGNIIGEIFKFKWSKWICELSLSNDSPSLYWSQNSSCDDIYETDFINIVSIFTFICSLGEIVRIFKSFHWAWLGHNFINKHKL